MAKSRAEIEMVRRSMQQGAAFEPGNAEAMRSPGPGPEPTASGRNENPQSIAYSRSRAFGSIEFTPMRQEDPIIGPGKPTTINHVEQPGPGKPTAINHVEQSGPGKPTTINHVEQSGPGKPTTVNHVEQSGPGNISGQKQMKPGNPVLVKLQLPSKMPSSEPAQSSKPPPTVPKPNPAGPPPEAGVVPTPGGGPPVGKQYFNRNAESQPKRNQK
jgi:hypothetical protein